MDLFSLKGLCVKNMSFLMSLSTWSFLSNWMMVNVVKTDEQLEEREMQREREPSE